MILILLAMILVSNLSAEGAPVKAGLVTSFSPTGVDKNVANNAAFKVTFAEPIVPKEKVGQVLPVEDFPFEVMPSIQAEGRWLDQSTFSASLLAPLNMATAYIASIKEDLKTLKGKNVGGGAYSFRTAAPSLLSARATASGGREVNVRLDFNMPVFPSRLRGFLTISDTQGRRLEYRISGGVSKSVNASVAAGGNNRLLVRIAAGLTGEAGNLAFE